ncbi:uncharacterized protein [Battus philenor]|uniref:uncharacterized protein n=1 Tax=Battus philenor TaxID=42288 RepID=UPI0035CED53E
MWKYVTRRIRDVLEKSVNHFDKRSSTGIVNSTGSTLSEDQDKRSGVLSCWKSSRNCWKSTNNDNDAKSKRWNFDDLNRSWLGAITWSSALVLGWYTSQLIHLKHKRKKCHPMNCWFSTLHPYLNYLSKNVKSLNSSTRIQKAIADVRFNVTLISNEHKANENNENTNSKSSSNSDDALREVLNSIENRLGLAAIKNGQHQDGLNMLRSAANHNHAPAQFNLGLCYENGLGVTIDEKMAMELYRSAAAQQHPGALYNLGIYYGQGRGGLTRDPTIAKRLLRLAAVQGQQDAIKALLQFDEDLSEQKYAEKWEHPSNLYSDGDVPTQSVLFVENNERNFNFNTLVY